jgi:hypothetical protein
MLQPYTHSDKTVTIKPIETRAYGRRFRSRLEARWAVFFETLGLRWEYEPESFDIDGEPYLPDFRVWTPQGEPIWYEIRPRQSAGSSKFYKFDHALNGGRDWETITRCQLLSGDPLVVLEANHLCPRCGFVLSGEQFDFYGDHTSVYCEPCDWQTPGRGHPIQNDGLVGASYETCKGFILTDVVEWNWLSRRIGAAAAAALSARFEHGETP